MPAKSNKNYTVISASGDVKYAIKKGNLNFLLRNKKIVLNTEKNQETYNKKQLEKKLQLEKRIEQAKANAKILENAKITFETEVSDDKLYTSINTKLISQLLLEQKNVNIPHQQIILPESIKTIGIHNIMINLEKDISSTITLVVAQKYKK